MTTASFGAPASRISSQPTRVRPRSDEELRQTRRHPSLQGAGVLEPELTHAPAGSGAHLPLGSRALVAADVDPCRREDLEELAEHVEAELDRRLVQVEDVIADAPAREHLEWFARVTQLRVGGDRRLHVTGHVDLRHDRHEAPGRVGDNLVQVRLGVEAAVRRSVEAMLRDVPRARLAPPGPDLGEPRPLLDWEPPALVVGEVEVEHVHLVQREDVDQAQDECLRHEMPRYVEMGAPPSKTRPVLDIGPRHLHDRRQLARGRRAQACGREKLKQGAGPVEDARWPRPGDVDAARVRYEPVAVGRPAGTGTGLDPQGDRAVRAVLAGVADLDPPSRRRLELGAQQRCGAGRGLVGRDDESVRQACRSACGAPAGRPRDHC